MRRDSVPDMSEMTTHWQVYLVDNDHDVLDVKLVVTGHI